MYMDVQKPSEVLDRFIDWLEICRVEYEEAYAIVGEEDKRLQDLLHALEFAENKGERNRTATKFQKSRKRRRMAKNKVAELQKIYDFCKDQNNKPTLKRLKGIIPKQKDTEIYLESEKTYTPRVGDES